MTPKYMIFLELSYDSELGGMIPRYVIKQFVKNEDAVSSEFISAHRDLTSALGELFFMNGGQPIAIASAGVLDV